MSGLRGVLALYIWLLAAAGTLAGCADRPVSCEAHLIPINPSTVPEAASPERVKPP